MLNLKKCASIEKCCELARGNFEEYYHDSIAQLLHIFPEDFKDKDGQSFWSGPKRAPYPIKFDQNDPLHAEYIYSTANLYAFALGLEADRDKAKIVAAAAAIHVPQFVPKSNVKIQTEEAKAGEEEKKDDSPPEPEDEEVLA